MDRLHSSKIHNLKELRPRVGGASEIRLLFVFDPSREAIILVAGDKAGAWNRWYTGAIALGRSAIRLIAVNRGAEGRPWGGHQAQDREIRRIGIPPSEAGALSAAGRSCAPEQRGYQLAQLRKNAGLTQAQVAAAMAVSQPRVSHSSMARSPRWTRSVAMSKLSAGRSMSLPTSAIGPSGLPEPACCPEPSCGAGTVRSPWPSALPQEAQGPEHYSRPGRHAPRWRQAGGRGAVACGGGCLVGHAVACPAGLAV